MGFQELALLLLLFLPLCSAQSTYYVTPTPDTPCPGQTCYSLSEYICPVKPCYNLPAVVDFLTSDAVLVFLPGNYSLETSITFEGTNSLALSGDVSSLPQVTTNILCSQQASIVFTSIAELFITDIALVSCGNPFTPSVRIDQVPLASISYCFFQGGQKGALAVYNSKVYLANNTFENNSARLGGAVYIDTSVVNFTGNSFVGNYGSDNGAAVFVSPGGHSTVSFSLNRFINNTGGGAIVYVDPTSEVHFGENIFANNSVGINAVYESFVQDASMYYVIPTAHSPCPDERCYTLSHIIEKANHYITSNTSLVFLPGNHTVESGLLIRNIASLTMLGSHSSFTTTNLICSKPASFAIYNVSEVYISSLAFLSCGNNAIGATITLNLVFSSQILNCSFHNSTNTNDGNGIGGALAIESSRINLSGNLFTNNIATSTHGGSVYINNSIATVSTNIFINNRANGWGGGIYLQNCSVSLNANLFMNNTASYGGGIEASYGSCLNATNNNFTGNIAGRGGGGIDIYVRVVANFVGNMFEGNTARTLGGGISVYNCSTTSFTQDSFISNTADKRGGAIFANSSTIKSTQSNFTANMADRGGSSYLESGTGSTFFKNMFIYNSAWFNGAGIYIALDTTNIECTNNTFKSNVGGGWVLFIEDSRSTSALLSQNTYDNNTGNVVYRSSQVTPSVYHITPSPDTPCPNEPCLTISEFIDQAGQYIALNTTLMFLPGTHTVRSGLLVENITSLTLLGDSSDESFPLIKCNGPASLGFKYIHELIVRSLAFDSCGDGTYAAFSVKSVSSVEISNCSFKNSSGGAVVVTNCSTLHITETLFENNSAVVGGGLYVSESALNFTRNTFTNNRAEQLGGGLYANRSTVNSVKNTFTSNKAEFGGAGITLIFCSATYSGMATFSENSVSGSGRKAVYNDREFRENPLTSADTVSSNAGGAMLIFTSNITFPGNIRIENNNADYGGGIMAIESDLSLKNTVSMQNNTAIYGGGVYILESAIIFSESISIVNNRAEDSGGAVYAIDNSQLYFERFSNFSYNTAAKGGGLYLDHSSLCHFSATSIFLFEQNHAREIGGAIFVADATPSIYCAEDFASKDIKSDCFFQIQTDERLYFRSEILARIFFSSNTANLGGGDLYGGSIDNCIISHIDICSDFCDIKSSGSVFDTLAIGEVDIASVPLQVRSCEDQISQFSSIELYPGKSFSVSVSVLGQRNGTVSQTTSIQAQTSGAIIISDLQKTQNSTKSCSKLNFTIFSSTDDGNGSIMLSTGPCSHNHYSLTFQVQIQKCPPGFNLNKTTCDCADVLFDNCDVQTGMIFRPSESEFWVGYTELDGLIIHPHCPFDYCIEDELYVSVNDSDTQCNYNRTGKLCGGCSGSTSLVLGSSRCMQCSNNYLALIIAFAFAGIILVFFLSILKLTVGIGTINGLIFYANLVQVNSSIFYPPGTTNILTVFVAWINLDFGIETCFYDGMDIYAKTWLQFVFPIYIWLLVGIIILISHFSRKITAILGSNPIAVLATLFLISYAKILRTIIAALSITSLGVELRASRIVWPYDGNIKYISGRHTPLFIAALLSLILLFLPFTLLLSLGQWLQMLQAKTEWRILSWINKPSFRAFLDAYHAPYTCSHRYWTGLLLWVRCILFLIFATIGNVFTEVYLLTVSSVVTGIITLATTGIYRNGYFGILEASFLLNLVLLTTVTSHIKAAGGNQAVATFTSLSIAFATFVGIVIYHISLQFRGTKMREMVASQVKVYSNRISSKNRSDIELLGKEEKIASDEASITTSFVELREPLLDDN